MPSIRDIFPAQVGVNSIVTTKGDLLVRDSTSTTKLGVGTNGQVLVADSVSPEGIAWQTVDTSFATINIAFIQPAVQSSIQITLSTNKWIQAGMYIYIETGGVYYVLSTSGTNLVTVRNEYDSNATQGILINTTNAVVPSGQRGNDGTDPYALITAGFTVPSVNSNVVVSFDQTGWNAPGQIVFIQDAGFYEVVSIATLDVTVKNLGYSVNATSNTTISTGRLAVPGGIRGEDGVDGVNAYSTTTANFTQPAAGNNVNVNIDVSQWMSVGQSVYVENGGAYTVISVGSLVQLRNDDAVGNATPNTVINSGSSVSPSGLTGPSGTSAIAYNLVSNFVQPAVNATVSINVDTTAFTVEGSYIFIPTGGFYKVITITDATNMVVENIEDNDNAGVSSNISQPQVIIGSARPGDDGTDGQTVDHVSLTNTVGDTRTYTFWGDVGETINLGTFDVTDGATGSVNTAVSLALDHQIADPVSVVNKLILYSKSTGLYHIQPNNTVRRVLMDDEVGTLVGNLFTLVDVGGNPGLPALDGSNLTGLNAEFDNDITIVPSITSSLTTGSSEIIGAAYPPLVILKSLETTFDSDIEVYAINETITGIPNSNVKLMLNFNGTDGATTTADSSQSSKTVTLAGAAQLSNAQSLHGGTSLSLTGAIGTYGLVPYDTDFDFGTGDYTIEGWFYCTTFNSSSSLISNCILSTDFFFGGNSSGEARKFGIRGDSGNVLAAVAEAQLNTWTHFANVRVNGVSRLYIDGIEVLSTPNTNSYTLQNDTTNIYIGTLASQLLDPGRTFTGFIEDLRITKGQAQYNSQFTPPAIEISEDLIISINSLKTYTNLLANTKLDTNLIVYNKSTQGSNIKLKVTNNDAGTQTIGVTSEIIAINPEFNSITIQNEGMPLPQQENINFTGDLVHATNNVGNGAIDISINSGLNNLGDIIYHNGIGLAKLPRGFEGQVLKTSDINGVNWDNETGGSGTTSFDNDIRLVTGTTTSLINNASEVLSLDYPRLALLKKITTNFDSLVIIKSGDTSIDEPWTPAQITTELWLDADDASTITIETGVSEWRDKSGNLNHAIQLTGSNQPFVTTNGQNGRDVITFGGNLKYLDINGLNIGDQGSVFIVYKRTNSPINNFNNVSFILNIGTDFATASNRVFQFVYDDDGGFITGIFQAGSIGLPSNIPRNDDWNIHYLDFKYGTAFNTRFNGDNLNNQILGAQNVIGTTARIGKDLWSEISPFEFIGDIAEIIITNSILSITNRQNIEGYLAEKWGIQSKLPINHPYKDSFISFDSNILKSYILTGGVSLDTNLFVFNGDSNKDQIDFEVINYSGATNAIELKTEYIYLNSTNSINVTDGTTIVNNPTTIKFMNATVVQNGTVAEVTFN